MGIELSLTPENIDELVRESIMKAGFGKAVTEGVQKALGGYNSPIDAALKDYVGGVCRELIRDKFAAQIRELVTAHIEKMVTAELLENITSKAVNEMVKAVDRY